MWTYHFVKLSKLIQLGKKYLICWTVKCLLFTDSTKTWNLHYFYSSLRQTIFILRHHIIEIRMTEKCLFCTSVEIMNDKPEAVNLYGLVMDFRFCVITTIWNKKKTLVIINSARISEFQRFSSLHIQFRWLSIDFFINKINKKEIRFPTLRSNTYYPFF